MIFNKSRSAALLGQVQPLADREQPVIQLLLQSPAVDEPAASAG